jgi:hypothetical protein
MVEDRDQGKRILEIEYQALSQEINQLMESRALERRSIDEINHWWSDLSTKRSPEDLLRHLSECESLMRLHSQTSGFQDQYRCLKTRLAELGQQLGYW